MNKLFAVTAAGFCCIAISCSDTTTPSESVNSIDGKLNQQAQENIAAWHKVNMAFQTGNADMIDSVVAHDYIDHRSNGDVKGRDSVKASIVKGQMNFKDVKMETIREIADDEYAFFWIRFTGINIKSPGMPSGPFDMITMQVVRFRDGMAIEHWEYMDPKQIMQSLQRANQPEKK